MRKNIYVCGPTVYSKVHIGNIRPILTFDIFIRSLKHLGMDVNFIHNITDIDDKIINKSIEEGVSEKEISERYTNHYFELLKLLNVTTLTSVPKVVENMSVIIEFVKKLVALNKAYVVDGTVYFDVTSVKNYGELSNRNLDESQYELGSGKKHPADFALWKKTNVGVTFDSPWGKGRPGWHTECAAFIDNELHGEQLDIHGGGIDLIFPHHENESAQYKALYGVGISKEWKHVGHIKLNGEKMSKSLGNVFDAEEFITNFGADTLRILFFTKNITNPLDLTDEVIDYSKDLANKYSKYFIKAKLISKNEEFEMEKIWKISQFIQGWDFNSAFVEYNLLVKDFNKKHDNTTANNLIEASKLIGFSFINKVITDKQRQIYNEWIRLREDLQFDRSDELREILIKDGLI